MTAKLSKIPQKPKKKHKKTFKRSSKNLPETLKIVQKASLTKSDYEKLLFFYFRNPNIQKVTDTYCLCQPINKTSTTQVKRALNSD
jgi:hypothetical protein